MDNSGDLGAWEATTFDLSFACFFLGREGPGKTPPLGSGAQVKRELGVGCTCSELCSALKGRCRNGENSQPYQIGKALWAGGSPAAAPSSLPAQ